MWYVIDIISGTCLGNLTNGLAWSEAGLPSENVTGEIDKKIQSPIKAAHA